MDRRRTPLPTYKIIRTDTATGETTVVDQCKPFTSVDQPLTAPDTYGTWADDDAPLSARRQVNGSSLADTEILCPTVADGATHVYKVAATDDRLLHDDNPLDVLHPAEVPVTLPDTRPPGWTETDVREGQYPELYVGCSESSGLGDCSRFTSYRVERWDPATASYTTLAEGTTGDAAYYMDMTVHEDLLGLYYYRVVRLDASGAEAATRSTAYGIWNSWL
ncbi:hypothetical protein [Streptomyces parvus]|uniref:hypothetical protein n=1 Tax=Streptomyces parvus TaxID=66428 RepID=UPI001EF2496D|nr:hypothetical protein [Streptomyces parvus]